MQHLEVSCAVRRLFKSLGFKGLTWRVQFMEGRVMAQWLRRCATSRTVPGSIPSYVTGFFSDTFPSDWTMALQSTRPLVKMSTGNIPEGKGGQCIRLTTYHHTVPSWNLGALTSQNSLGLFWPVTGQLYCYNLWKQAAKGYASEKRLRTAAVNKRLVEHLSHSGYF